jgi:hypothetical protein
MNGNQEMTLRKVLTKNKKILRSIFGGAFDMTFEENGGKIVIQMRDKDSGHEMMTYGDVAAYCGVELGTVRYWNRARTRATAKYPFPRTVDLGGPRVKRTELISWWEKMQGK